MPGEGVSSTKIDPEELKLLLAADLSRPSVVLSSAPPWNFGAQLDKDKGNWLEWSRYVQGALVGNGLFRYCKPNPPIPDSTTQPRAYANWRENDERVCGFLSAGCSDNEAKRLIPLDRDAAKYWKLLEQRHTQQGPMAQMYLMRDAMAITLEAGNITDYVEKVSKICDLLDKVWAMGALDLDALKRVVIVSAMRIREQDQAALIDDIRRGTTNGSPFTAEDAIRFAEERQLVISKKDDSSTIALSAKTKSSDNACANCKKPRHSAKYCIAEGGGMAGRTIEESISARKKDREAGKSSSGGGAGKSKGHTIPVSFTDKDGRAFTAQINTQHLTDATLTPAVHSTALISTLPTNLDPDTTDYETYGFTALNAVSLDDDDIKIRCSLDWNDYTKPTAQPPVISALNQTQSTPISTTDCPFYVDSGASMHLSPDRCDFISLRPIASKSIHGVGGSSVAAIAVGDIQLQLKTNRVLVLRNVLYVPNATVRLISVAAITHHSRTDILFSNVGCTFVDRLTNATIAEGTYIETTRLYSLDLALSAAIHAHSVSIHPTLETYHRRLGHASLQVVNDMARLGAVKGMPKSFQSKPSVCDSCVLGKQTRSPVPKVRSEENGHGSADRRLKLIWVDLTGKFAVVSVHGNEYIMCIVDDYSHKPWSIPLAHKNEAFAQLKAWIILQENQTGEKVCVIRIDGGELRSDEFLKWAASRGIKVEFTAPYTSAHIGRVERMHRTIMGRQRAMRAYAKLPPYLWEELYLTATFLTGMTSTRTLNNKCPDELWYSRKPDISFLREIGCRVFVLIQNKHNPKLWERSTEMVLIGYDLDSKAYKCWDRTRRTIHRSHHVRFIESHEDHLHRGPEPHPVAPITLDEVLESSTTAPINLNDSEEEECLPSDMTSLTPNPAQMSSSTNVPIEPLPDQDPVNPPAPITPQPTRRSTRVTSNSETRLQQAVEESREIGERKHNERMERRAAKRTLADIREEELRNAPEAVEQAAIEELCALFAKGNPNTKANVHMILSSIAASSSVDSRDFQFEDEPRTWDEAKRSPNAEQWEAGYREELKSLKDMGVYKLIPRSEVPDTHKIRKGRPVFKAKRDETGAITRYKVRLVFQGFEQVYGRDYIHTTSPTARTTSWRILLHIGAVLNWDMQQIDVKTAFLYGVLPDDEVQYMSQPKGFEEPGKEDHVWMLQRGLYGMKQAGRIWNKTLHESMVGWGFTRLSSEACIYYRSSTSGIIITAVHVDDFLSISDSPEENTRFKNQMKQAWTISDLGEPKFVVGIAVERKRDHRAVYLSQTALIDKIITTFGQSDAHVVSTPMDPGLKLRRPDQSKIPWEDKERLAKFPYRSLVGCLIYLTVGTRPDIAYAVQQLSQFLDSFSYAHWNAAIRVVRYLKGTRDLKLKLGGSVDIKLLGFTDSDWANCLDTRRSVGGYGFTLGSGLISWSARKQATVATSSTEAEYTAAFEASKEAIWLRTLLTEIHFVPSQATPLLCDNNSAITLSTDPSHHNRSKHFDIKLHFLRERVHTNEIQTAYINTKDNIADIFTKALPTQQFLRFRTMIGILQT